MRAARCAAVIAALLAGCSTKLDLAGRACPCGPGYDCCDSVCLPLPLPERCRIDAGARGDAQGLDAAQLDASMIDASSMDAPQPPPACTPPVSEGCEPGFARCGHASCDVRTTSDPSNCGVCGRSCRGGECQGGECLPIPLVRNAAVAGGDAFAVSGTAVHWATADGAMHSTAAPGAPLATSQGRIEYMVADDRAVYFLAWGGKCAAGACLRRVAIAAGPMEPSTMAEVPDGGRGLLLQSGILYWYYPGGEVRRLAVDGPPGRTSEVIASGQGDMGGLTSDAEFLYWGTRAAGEGFIKRQRLDGTALSPTAVLTGLGAVSAVAVDRWNVYWTEYDTHAVKMAPKTGGQPIPLASGQEQMVRIAVDERSVYWAGTGLVRAIVKVSRCGGGGQPKPAFLTMFPSKLVVEGGELHFAEGGVGVFRLPP
jgi:hypothetical protein